MIGAGTPLLAIVLHWTIALGLTCRILMARRSRGSGFAWIFITLSVPYVGAALYLMVGEVWLPKRRVRHVAELIQAERDSGAHAGASLPQATGIDPDLLRRFASLAEDASGIAMSAGNQIELLDGADSAFDHIIRDIESATTSCFILTYIWHPGGRTDEVAEALERAAERGVDCRVLADAHGSAAFFASKVHDRLRRAGVKVVSANKAGWLRLRLARIDLRNHRKIVVLDGRIGYTGSLNIVDPRHFKTRAGVGQWIDCMARLEGQAARDLQRVFLRDWSVENHASDSTPTPDRPPSSEHEQEGAAAQVLPSGPAQEPEVLRRMLLTQIHAARNEIIITTPYFVPDEPMMMALTSAARSGVRVRLIVPAKIDAVLVRHATRAYFSDLLDAGVEIHQFTRGLLHSKIVTTDAAVGMIGTANMDLRSFELNLEVSLFVYDTAFTSDLVKLQRSYIGDSRQLDLATWSHRSMAWTIVDNAAQLVAPVL